MLSRRPAAWRAERLLRRHEDDSVRRTEPDEAPPDRTLSLQDPAALPVQPDRRSVTLPLRVPIAPDLARLPRLNSSAPERSSDAAVSLDVRFQVPVGLRRRSTHRDRYRHHTAPEAGCREPSRRGAARHHPLGRSPPPPPPVLNACLFSFISVSVAAPTLMTAAPPASLASRSCSGSRAPASAGRDRGRGAASSIMGADTRSNSYGRPMSVLVVDEKEPCRQVMRRRAPWTSRAGGDCRRLLLAITRIRSSRPLELSRELSDVAVVTVWLPGCRTAVNRSLDGRSFALVDRAIDPTPLVVAGREAVDDTWFESPTETPVGDRRRWPSYSTASLWCHQLGRVGSHPRRRRRPCHLFPRPRKALSNLRRDLTIYHPVDGINPHDALAEALALKMVFEFDLGRTRANRRIDSASRIRDVTAA
jgi:hypothetical protein